MPPLLLRCLLPACALTFACLAACDSPPSAAGMPEWTAADHDRSEETARAAAGQQPGGQKPNAANAANGTRGPDPVLEAAWAQQCAPCHGVMGHGDGPTGPMVHAANLTLADWQAATTDEQMIASITNGKGKMPPFPNLPPKIVRGLVARIRASKGR